MREQQRVPYGDIWVWAFGIVFGVAFGAPLGFIACLWMRQVLGVF